MTIMAVSQPSLPFADSTAEKPTPVNQQSGETKYRKVIRLGDPAIPAGITRYGTYVAKLDHLWRAARTYAKRNNYNLLEMYGVIGVAPFCEDKVGAWFTYLDIPFRHPLEVYQLYDKDLTWIVEWPLT